MLNRLELCHSLKLLNTNLSLDCLKVIVNTLDKEETGTIEVNELIKQLFAASPRVQGTSY